MQKKCTKCGELKSEDDFSVEKRKGVIYTRPDCKECRVKRVTSYYRSIDGLIKRMYNSQILSSKRRKNDPPSYTLSDLSAWVKSQDNFLELYGNWVKSDYSRWMSPSCDRLDDYKGYSFKNIRLVAYLDNFNKGFFDRKNGVNNKLSKSVIQKDLNGVFINKYYSVRQAARDTGAGSGNIILACKGKIHTSMGFIWEYAD